MYTNSMDEELALLKRMWSGDEVICPKCGIEKLAPLHKKAKKSDCDLKCPKCGEIFRTIRMLKELQNG